MTIQDDHARREARALGIAMWGNLLMAAAGLAASVLSNSTAILMDGLFSLVGFGSALLARRISARLSRGPDKLRPFGYAADEALFSTFRALTLLGLITFAVASAARNILSYLAGARPDPLVFAPMAVYFAVVGLTCAGIWTVHHLTWRRTGRTSAILRLKAKAAAFDTLVTAAAGAGLIAIHLGREGPLAPIAPVGDSIVVLLLCVLAVGINLRAFRMGLSELAGVSAAPSRIAIARRALRPALAEAGGTLRDLSVTTLGRSHLVTVYHDPGRAMTPAEIDTLTLRLIREARVALPGSDVLLIVTEHPRRWPAHLDPFGSPEPGSGA